MRCITIHYACVYIKGPPWRLGKALKEAKPRGFEKTKGGLRGFLKRGLESGPLRTLLLFLGACLTGQCVLAKRWNSLFLATRSILMLSHITVPAQEP